MIWLLICAQDARAIRGREGSQVASRVESLSGVTGLGAPDQHCRCTWRLIVLRGAVAPRITRHQRDMAREPDCPGALSAPVRRADDCRSWHCRLAALWPGQPL